MQFRSALTLGRRGAHVVAAGVLIASAAFAVIFLRPVILQARGHYLAFNDFFAQWSFAVFAHLRDPVGLYDYGGRHRFQLALEPNLRQFFPYPYPPTYLFAIWPLGWLPFGAAQLVWDLAGLALFLWAVFGRDLRTTLLPFVVLAPATVIALAYGQNGLLISGLIVGGLRVMRTRPMLGGVLLGLATIKPQLGILIPVALIAARQWRVLGAAACAAIGLAGLSVLAFGVAMWPAWLETVSGHAGWLAAAVNDYRKPTVLATLSLLGAPAAVARGVQAGVTAGVIAVIWFCFRRGVSDLSIAAVESGTFLAMPFVFHYDLPMLTNAVLLLVRDGGKSRRVPGLVETGIVVLALLFPALTSVTTRFFYVNSVALIAVFGLSVWRKMKSYDRESRSYDPTDVVSSSCGDGAGRDP